MSRFGDMMDDEGDYRQAAELASALRADPEMAHRGEVLLSIETSSDRPLCVDWLIGDNLGSFLRLMKEHKCTPHQRVGLLSYYVLGKNQTDIAKVLEIGQSQFSSLLRRGLSKVGGLGPNYRSHKEQTATALKDPDCLGEFRIAVTDVNKVFSAKSTVRAQATDASVTGVV